MPWGILFLSNNLGATSFSSIPFCIELPFSSAAGILEPLYSILLFISPISLWYPAHPHSNHGPFILSWFLWLFCVGCLLFIVPWPQGTEAHSWPALEHRREQGWGSQNGFEYLRAAEEAHPLVYQLTGCQQNNIRWLQLSSREEKNCGLWRWWDPLTQWSGSRFFSLSWEWMSDSYFKTSEEFRVSGTLNWLVWFWNPTDVLLWEFRNRNSRLKKTCSVCLSGFGLSDSIFCL